MVDYLDCDAYMAGAMTRHALILSNVRWDYLWQRHQSIAQAAARDGWTVDFIDPPIRTLNQATSLLARKLTTRAVQPAVQRIQNAVPDGVTVRSGLRAAAGLRIPRRNSADLTLLYLPSRRMLHYALRAQAGPILYDQVIEWRSAPREFWPPSRWDAVESRLRELAHAGQAKFITDNVAMAEVERRRGVSSSAVLPAADDAFTMIPARVRAQGRRFRIGYFGSVRSETDTPLLAKLAEVADIDIVGEVKQSRELLANAGIRLNAAAPITALAAHITKWDAIILPYRGERASTLSPAKLFNAIATGRPVFVRGLQLDALGLRHEREVFQLPEEDGSVPDFILKTLLDLDLGEQPATWAPTLAVPTWTDRWAEIKQIAGID